MHDEQFSASAKAESLTEHLATVLQLMYSAEHTEEGWKIQYCSGSSKEIVAMYFDTIDRSGPAERGIPVHAVHLTIQPVHEFVIFP